MPDKSTWPVAKGDYILGSSDSPVAVAIIGGGNLELPSGAFAIKGTVKTENFGLEKIVANVVANPRLRFLIVCGNEEYGHLPGNALLCLWKNGVGPDMRISGTKAAIPFLCNTTPEQIERFRQQVEIIDLMHLKEAEQSREYSPSYEIGPSERQRILDAIASLVARDPGRFPKEPIISVAKELKAEGTSISEKVLRSADSFTNQMLRMPSEGLNIYAASVVISQEFNVILDSVDGVVKIVVSIPSMERLKMYLWGKGKM
jgi:tetrahydromethanopterin S-methyltransferase subunit A